MALHENFRDYTAEEIADIKKNVCLKHKCPYLQRLHEYTGKSISPNDNICDYIGVTGRIRECMPDDCTHWSDTNIKKKRKRRSFTKDDGTNFNY